MLTTVDHKNFVLRLSGLVFLEMNSFFNLTVNADTCIYILY